MAKDQEQDQEQEQNLPTQNQDFVLYCVDKMQSIPDNLPEKIKTMMMDTIGQRMEMYLDQEEANTLSKSNLLPKEYKENPSNIMLAFKTGRSLGLDRLQSLQHTVTINGKTRVYGDMMHALAMKHRDYKDIRFEYGPDIIVDKTHGTLPEYVKCTVILDERDDVENTYTLENARRNPNFNSEYAPWMTGHARRMMKFRAQSFSLRDAFPDKLSGVYDEYEFEEIQTVNKDITGQTTDLGKQNGASGLKDSLKEDEPLESTEPEVEIQDKDGKPIKTDDKNPDVEEQEPTAQEKPENIEQIKTDMKQWAKDKIVSKEDYQKFADTGSAGKWDEVVKMHKKFSKKAANKPLGKFAKKLSKIVDDEGYSESINSLVIDDSVDLISPENVGKVLRTKDEKLAKEAFKLIEDRKDVIDSAKKDEKGKEETY